VNILLVDLEKEWRGGQNQAFLLLKGLNARGDCAELMTVKGSALGRRAARRRMKVHFVTDLGSAKDSSSYDQRFIRCRARQ
jgi:hypothetical protein